MTDLRQAAQQALEALDDEHYVSKYTHIVEAITALREALEQPEQEPVAYLWQHCETGRTRIVMPDDVITVDATWFVVGPLFTHPTHDDTALLRQCLEGYESMTGRKPERIEKLVTTLRERLGEKT